jgi:hypothetical protein
MNVLFICLMFETDLFFKYWQLAKVSVCCLFQWQQEKSGVNERVLRATHANCLNFSKAGL